MFTTTIGINKECAIAYAKRVAAGLFLAGLIAGAIGCNTTEGAGRDIKSAGKGIEEAAQDNK